MKLAEFRASYPLFELQSEVTFQTPRAPTVVERMILRLIVTATAAIGDMTLAGAFTGVLGMGCYNALQYQALWFCVQPEKTRWKFPSGA